MIFFLNCCIIFVKVVLQNNFEYLRLKDGRKTLKLMIIQELSKLIFPNPLNELIMSYF